MATMWPTVRRVWREEGVRGVWFRGLGRAGYRRLTLWERPIGTAVVTEFPPGFRLLEIGPEELDLYLRFRTDQSEATVRQRWQRGERCHAVEHDGALVHCAWSGAGIAWIDLLRCRMMLPSDVVYLFDAVSAAPYRGQGLAWRRSQFMAGLYGSQGFLRFWSATLPENVAARRFQQRLGSRPVGQLRRWPWNAGWIARAALETAPPPPTAAR